MFEKQINELPLWLTHLMRPDTLFELLALAFCAWLAWLLTRLAAKAVGVQGGDADSITFGRRIVDGVLFPVLWLVLVYPARELLELWTPLAVFRIAVPVLLALAVIRLGVKVLHAAFGESPLVRFLERIISWLAWLTMVLWVSGLLPFVLTELDQISWQVGSSRLSVRKIIEGSLTAGLVLIITLWISSALEARLLRNTAGSELSLRKAFSNAARALLMFVGLLVATSAVGIDLSALSVLGGAIGVGIGFGLQKLAANYVSGFVVLAERSMRIGDIIQVDGFTGAITEINARYTVIRSVIGRESIVPNEMLLTNRIENLSLADTKVWHATNVSVAYDSDIELVSKLLLQAAMGQERVLKDPGPAVALLNFGADGLEFRVGYWIADPENGVDNLRSLVNLEILQLFRAHNIEIPFPQRVVYQRSA